MSAYNTPLSRSYSRATLLYFCQKKYMFSYYTKYLSGFERNFYQECLTLKNLTSLHMRLGEKIHGLMSDYLHELKKQGSPGLVDPERLEHVLADFSQKLDTEYEKSKKKHYDKYDKYDKFGFAEHFYGEDIDEDYKKAKQRIKDAFYGFLESDLHTKISKEFQEAQAVFVESKEPDFEKMKMTIDRIPELTGIQLWAQPDLGLIIPAGENGKKRYIIYDRKSGRERDEEDGFVSDQLKVYAYKMLLKLGMENFDNVEIYCYEVFLKSMKVLGGKIEREDIYHIEQKITIDVINQKKLLQHQNPIKNIPLPSSSFFKTTNINKCKSCRFRKVCEELTHYEEATEDKFFQ